MPFGKYSHHLPRSSPPPGNLTLPGARPGSTRTEERNPLQIPSHHITGSIHRSAWNRNSRKFISKILHSPAPTPLQSPPPGAPFGPAPLELVTPVYRYSRSL